MKQLFRITCSSIRPREGGIVQKELATDVCHLTSVSLARLKSLTEFRLLKKPNQRIGRLSRLFFQNPVAGIRQYDHVRVSRDEPCLFAQLFA